MSTEDYINHDYSMIKDDQRKRGGCGKPGHVTSTPDPAEGDAATLYCVTCEAEAKAKQKPDNRWCQRCQNGETCFAVIPCREMWPPETVPEKANDACGHVPARPDVDLTLCWICGEEIIPDPATHLWRPLTDTEKLVKYETTRQLRDLFFNVHQSEFGRILFERLEHKDKPAIRIAESIMGRWIIINGRDEGLAWSGSRWVPHRQGLATGGAFISNWETREEADAYANETFPQTGR